MDQQYSGPITIFYSYAPEDEVLRNELEKHLALLQRNSIISAWHNRRIVPGADWAHEIDYHLNEAFIILLLISPDFLASDYCYQIEMQRALERHRLGEACVIPIILRPVDWHEAPFAHLQCLPHNKKPVTKWKNKDDAFHDIAAGIHTAIEHLYVPSQKSMRSTSPTSQESREPSVAASSMHTVPTENDETRQKTLHTLKPTVMQIPSRLVFHFNTALNDPSDFYGRTRERATLLSRIYNRASVAIVGPRRIGKTWLMQYVKLVADGSDLQDSRFAIGYLNATNPQCRTVAGFTTKAAEALRAPVQKIEHAYGGLGILARVVEDLCTHHVIPVLCIDEFEGFGNPQEFDLEFLEGLRAMTQETLVLVTASKRPLLDVVVNILGEHARTSPFFNVFEHIMLKPFNRKEAETFVYDKGIKAGFTEQERLYLLERATVYSSDGEKYWPPLRLQLVGQMLLDDKNAAQEGAEHYCPHDPKYWIDFERRLNEQYKTVVER